jgi:uncharacterized protein
MEKLVEIALRLANEVKNYNQIRYLYDKINWKNRLIGIVGARGTGKTTLLLQRYIKEYNNPEKCLYFSADHYKITNIYEVVEQFFNYGGETVFIDEIHKYPNWKIEIKNLYDSFPKKKIVFTGSSSISILKSKSDLSRRVIFYNLQGLSFREYLNFSLNTDYKVQNLDNIINNHISISETIVTKIPVLKYFAEYLKMGYYPFVFEGKDSFYQKLDNIIEKILYEDFPIIYNVNSATVSTLKKIFNLVATSEPFTFNISNMSNILGISREYVYQYIENMNNAGLLKLIYPYSKGKKTIRKPEKIYLNNPNLFYAVKEEKGFGISQGTIRETFFANQFLLKLFTVKTGDFIDTKNRVYEIGGKNKSITSPDILYALDSINTGFKNKIPLWLFGFLY